MEGIVGSNSAAFNQTNVELKYLCKTAKRYFPTAFNQTNVELKFDLKPLSLVEHYF